MKQNREKTLIFQHIPKTAGTTLSFIVARHFDEDEIFHIRNPQQMKGPAYSPHFGSLEQFTALVPEEKNRYRCIIGHMHFGVHRHVNASSEYIAFIRDPVKRVISQYGQYVRMIKAGDINGEPPTLEQFLSAKPAVMNNHQTRFISGRNFTEHTPESCYEKALENIEAHFAFVGLVERFDESLVLLSSKMDWQNATYVKRNTGIYRPSLQDVPPSLLEKIHEANQWDHRLHQYLSSRLDKQIRIYGPSFDRDLQAFQKKQKVSQGFNKALNHLRQMIPPSLKRWIRRIPATGKFINQ